MPGILSAGSLPNIQGNILTPFKKDCFFYLFARFRDAQEARRWVASIVADPKFASTQKMLDEPTRPVWLAVAFTFQGIVVLRPDLNSGLAEFQAFLAGAAAERAYGDDGPKTSAALVGDPAASDPSGWVLGHPDRSPVHVVLTIAADDDAFDAAVQDEQDRADGHGLEVLHLDQGNNTKTPGQPAGRLDRAGTDHFGFRDGISQPGVRGFTPEVIRNRRLEVAGQPGSPVIAPGEFVLGYDAEPRFYAVPGASRPTPPPWMRDGSFQVLLRLTQDVRGWRSQEARVRTAVTSAVDVAESAIGRKRSGCPLAPIGHNGFGGNNDFTYIDDDDGTTTPLGAHIRKMNPRDDDVFHDRQHRLLRRGTSFGPLLTDDKANNGVTRGMMFNAFMTSIEDQFEYVQRHWANPFSSSSISSRTFAGSPEHDALIGAGRRILIRQPGGTPVDVAFAPHVHTSGAVYAFAPSIPALQKEFSA